jgi:hypothetical protein
MKNLKKNLLSLMSIFLISCFALSCSDSDDEVNGTSRVIVKMTDAPGDYDAVFVDVLDVRVKNSSNSDESGWESIGNINPGIYNLLELTGGVTVLLADNEIPSGFAGQIRLILGENNSVVKDGITYPLNTPSAQQSGLKLQINQTLQPNVTYNFLIDFDVNQSIVVEAGNSGNFNLHPVLRVTTEAVSGSITGVAIAGEFQVLASVTVGGEVVSAFTNENGVFFLHGIPNGTYALTITPEIDSNLLPVIIENVIVTNGETTDVGVISLE